MNIFNRVVVVLDIVLTMIIVTLLLLFPQQGLMMIQATAKSLLDLGARIRPEFVSLFRAILILIAVFVDVALVALLIAEFRGPRRKYIRVASITGGHVSVTIDSIAGRLRYHIDPLPDVLAVKPRVSRKGDGVALALEIEAMADINVPRKAEEVLEITRQVIEDKLGLKLAGKPQVIIRTITAPSGAPPKPVTPATDAALVSTSVQAPVTSDKPPVT